MKDNGELTSSDQETVEVLGQYFKDVFTAEETKDVPVETERELDWEDTSVDFSVESIIKKLQTTDKKPTDKSPGPDGIHNLLLHNCASEVAELLNIQVVLWIRRPTAGVDIRDCGPNIQERSEEWQS